jgi:thioredoxin 1
MSNMQDISDDSFETDVIKSTLPVIVDFWAAWCGPCKALAPIVDDVASNYVGRVKFVKMDVDQNPSTPSRFGIRGIPTLILFKNGQVAATQVGLINKTDLAKLIDSHL